MTTQSTTQSLEEQTAQSGDHPTHKPCHPGRRALLLLLPCASSPSRTPPWLPCNLLPLHYLPLCSTATSIFPSDRDSQGKPPSVCPASPLWEDSRVLSSDHFPRPRILSQDTAVSGRRPPECKPSSYAVDHLSIGHLGGQEGQAYCCLLLPVEKGYSPSPPGKVTCSVAPPGQGL